jgi:ribosomal-protein-alanine N-acetyltransferase
MEQPILVNDTITLRPVRDSDQQKVFEGFSHPQVTKYFDITYPTFESTVVQMEWYKTNREKQIGYAWVVENEEQDFMGIFSLYQINKQHKRCELGYWLFPQYWQKGYASLAIQALLTFASENLKLHRIAAEIEPENTDSLKLLAKLGFEREAMLKDFEFKNGQFNSLEIWAKLLS